MDIDFALEEDGTCTNRNAKERFDLLETNAAILEAIGKQHAIDSKEYSALKNAGIALWFVAMEECQRFKKYLADFDPDRNLTSEKKARLIAMGFNLDTDPDSL